MSLSDFSYETPSPAQQQICVDVFHDQSAVLGEICDDLRKAGFKTGQAAEVGALLSGAVSVTGEVLLIDCTDLGAKQTAALTMLDMYLAGANAQVIVTTSLDALDAVFASLDQTAPQILIDASRAETMVAIGRAASGARDAKLREMTDEERVKLLRLTQQVDALAQRLDGQDEGNGSNSVRDKAWGWSGAANDRNIGTATAGAKAALPDPSYVRQIIRHRQARARFFDGDLFADPAWDMLLDLTASRGEGRPVSVTSLCIASGVPATTALRWVKQMVAIGLFERNEDTSDRRRAFIELSEKAADAMARYFCELRSREMAA